MAEDILNDIHQFHKILTGMVRHIKSNEYDIEKDDPERIAWSYIQKITR